MPIRLNNHIMPCNESGSTLRFMIPIGMLAGDQITFTGQGKLTTRPLDPYFHIFDQQGIDYSYNDALPLTLNGSLKSRSF